MGIRYVGWLGSDLGDGDGGDAIHVEFVEVLGRMFF